MSIYTSREQILQNFNIRAIVAFGSKTFGATGTNTVTLFLERYNEPPKIAELTKDSVSAIMDGEDISDFTDNEILEAYLAHQHLSKSEFYLFINREISMDCISAHPYFKIYIEDFKEPQYPKRASEEERQIIFRDKFFDYALSVEAEKIYYFALAMPQRTLVVTSPSDSKEQKDFLGYDWSNRKGSEGIVINPKGSKLYNDNDRFASETIASAIRHSFEERAVMPLHPDIQKYATMFNLVDMMDFSRSVFDKVIVPSTKRSLDIESKYQLRNLGDFARDISKGQMITKSTATPGDYKVVAGGIDYAYLNAEFNREPLVITVSASGANAGFVNIWKERIFASDCTTIKGDTDTETLYIFYYLKSIQDFIYTLQKGQAQPHVYPKDIAKLQIPDAPAAVIKKIVDECGVIDREFEASRMAIETYRKKIQDVFDRLEIVNKSKMGGVKS